MNTVRASNLVITQRAKTPLFEPLTVFIDFADYDLRNETWSIYHAHYRCQAFHNASIEANFYLLSILFRFCHI
jgi:hypothetical protein